MSFHADGGNLKLGRGALFVALWSAGVAPNAEAIGTFIGNVTSLEMTSENETREKYSSTEQSSPLLDRRVVRQSYELLAACDEHTMGNLALFMSGQQASVAQSSGTGSTATLNDVVLGDSYYVGARNVTAVVITGKTEGTDYLLDAEAGIITILATGTITAASDVTVTFNKPAATISKIQGGLVASPSAKITFIADDSNADGEGSRDKLTVWKATVSPDGGYQFISDAYGNFSLRFSVVSDSTNHPTEPFFTHERV